MRQVPHQSTTKVTLLSCIGSGLEYYDFSIYAIFASFISKQFFPHTDHFAALIATFSIFALGYFIRPIGGTLFGMIADRWGRKKTFSMSICCMAFATFAMGLAPTYATLGLSATIWFTLLRMIQGISFGAELPSSLTFLTEHVASKRRGLLCGYMISSVGLGVTLGSLVAFILTSTISAEHMLLWGWRIPFLLGGMLGLVGYYVRHKTQETPLFQQAKKHKNAWTVLLKIHHKKILSAIAMLLFPANFIIFYLCIPSCFQDIYGYTPQHLYLTMTIGYLWSALLLPIAGWMSDRIGRQRLFLCATIGFLCLMPFLFNLLYLKNIWALLLFVLTYQTIVAFIASCYFPLLAENFPTSVRCTGIAFCYNTTYALAAMLPILINAWYKSTHSTMGLKALFVIISLISIWGVLTMNEEHL